MPKHCSSDAVRTTFSQGASSLTLASFIFSYHSAHQFLCTVSAWLSRLVQLASQQRGLISEALASRRRFFFQFALLVFHANWMLVARPVQLDLFVLCSTFDEVSPFVCKRRKMSMLVECPHPSSF
eukprot:m.24627 g.24627  ORF g.24627 m.24627 type:complete len:125 (-) comp4310_c0_seq1:204-578(-)